MRNIKRKSNLRKLYNSTKRKLFKKFVCIATLATFLSTVGGFCLNKYYSQKNKEEGYCDNPIIYTNFHIIAQPSETIKKVLSDAILICDSKCNLIKDQSKLYAETFVLPLDKFKSRKTRKNIEEKIKSRCKDPYFYQVEVKGVIDEDAYVFSNFYGFEIDESKYLQEYENAKIVKIENREKYCKKPYIVADVYLIPSISNDLEEKIRANKFENDFISLEAEEKIKLGYFVFPLDKFKTVAKNMEEIGKKMCYSYYKEYLKNISELYKKN